jgi:hypothetical protein
LATRSVNRPSRIGEEQRVFEAWPELADDVAPVRQGHAEVAMQCASKPGQVSKVGRLIEAEFVAEGGQVLGRGVLTENRGCDVAGEDLRQNEDDERHNEQGEKSEADAAQDQSCHRRASPRDYALELGDGTAPTRRSEA